MKPPAADAGVDADALFDRATEMIREARTDPRREREAIPLFVRAAEAGHLQAMYELYWLYEDVSAGEGEETRRRDGEQAALWLRKAAEGGHLRALLSHTGFNSRSRGTSPGPRSGCCRSRARATWTQCGPSA